MKNIRLLLIALAAVVFCNGCTVANLILEEIDMKATQAYVCAHPENKNLYACLSPEAQKKADAETAQRELLNSDSCANRSDYFECEAAKQKSIIASRRALLPPIKRPFGNATVGETGITGAVDIVLFDAAGYGCNPVGAIHYTYSQHLRVKALGTTRLDEYVVKTSNGVIGCPQAADVHLDAGTFLKPYTKGLKE